MVILKAEIAEKLKNVDNAEKKQQKCNAVTASSECEIGR
jgi:hypothetical protein